MIFSFEVEKSLFTPPYHHQSWQALNSAKFLHIVMALKLTELPTVVREKSRVE
jgi:hypothetical protein